MRLSILTIHDDHFPSKASAACCRKTQCRECGSEGCLPYARAPLFGRRSAGKPVRAGGENRRERHCRPIGQALPAPAKHKIKAVALIDEAVCIGCTACIRAFVPSRCHYGRVHTNAHRHQRRMYWLRLVCCPRPVDCIDMVPVSQPFRSPHAVSAPLPNCASAAAEHAQAAFERYTARKQRAMMLNAIPYWRNVKPPSKPNRAAQAQPK